MTGGTTDPSFFIGTGFNDLVQSLALQPDGKVLVGGNFTQYNGVNINDYLVRLNSNGTLDSTFTSGGG
jgi:hypothetical protein